MLERARLVKYLLWKIEKLRPICRTHIGGWLCRCMTVIPVPKGRRQSRPQACWPAGLASRPLRLTLFQTNKRILQSTATKWMSPEEGQVALWPLIWTDIINAPMHTGTLHAHVHTHTHASMHVHICVHTNTHPPLNLNTVFEHWESTAESEADNNKQL